MSEVSISCRVMRNTISVDTTDVYSAVLQANAVIYILHVRLAIPASSYMRCPIFCRRTVCRSPAVCTCSSMASLRRARGRCTWLTNVAVLAVTVPSSCTEFVTPNGNIELQQHWTAACWRVTFHAFSRNRIWRSLLRAKDNTKATDKNCNGRSTIQRML